MTERIVASPLARKIAEEKGLDLARIRGTGPNGRIILRDLDAADTANPAAQAGASAPQPAASAPPAPAQSLNTPRLPDPRLYAHKERYDEIPLSPMQTSIAGRLAQAMQAMPHFYLNRRICVDALMDLRARTNRALADRGEKLSLNDFFIRAVALALMDQPEVNVSFTDTAILRHHHADIGVAVALPDGLITPIIQEAETKSVQQISKAVKELAARAGEKRLKPAEYEGGSFSVSNLGMFGIDQFTAVINPPQAAILAIGGAQERLVQDPSGEISKTIEVAVTLSCDHRAINGAVGAQFLQILADYCADPYLLMMS